MCPLPNPINAIEMIVTEDGIKKPKINQGCVGCGVCEELCPASSPSIVIKPRETYNTYYKKEQI